VALFGAVGLGLVAVPACVGGDGSGDYAVHLSSGAVPATSVVADGVAVPDCSGGGGVHDAISV
jgi:hypothetical protein